MCDVKAEFKWGSSLMFNNIPILHKAFETANRTELYRFFVKHQ
jgi:hypothetical protein